MRRIVLTALFSMAATALIAADDDHSDHLSELEGLRVIHAWTNATDEDHAFVYLEIENNRDAEITLVGAETDIAEEVHMLATDPSSGKEIELESIPVPAGAEMELAPGGLFLELHHLETALVLGEEFELELEFGDGAHLDIHVEIEAADATSHGHAGHNH